MSNRALGELPRTLTLPSGRRVTIERATTKRVEREVPPSLFADALALFERDIGLRDASGAAVDVRDLPLADFHVVRGVLTKAGLLDEDEVEVDCHNCGEVLVARPCKGLETGPWEDGEADDPELDKTADFGAPLPIAPIALGRVRVARTITLAART